MDEEDLVEGEERAVCESAGHKITALSDGSIQLLVGIMVVNGLAVPWMW